MRINVSRPKVTFDSAENEEDTSEKVTEYKLTERKDKKTPVIQGLTQKWKKRSTRGVDSQKHNASLKTLAIDVKLVCCSLREIQFGVTHRTGLFSLRQDCLYISLL